MSDYRYDTYQHYGTNAERLAFTPTPPSLTGSQPIYIWYETDTLTTWLYSTTWVQITGTGAGAPASDTYLTENDETATLANSRRVLAGTGITFDDTTPNVRTISATTSGIIQVAIPLTNADILALPTTPIPLVAAPAAGTRIKLVGGSYSFDTSAGAYTNINATAARLIIRHTGATNSLLNLIADDSNYTLTDFTSLLGTAGANVVDLTTFLQAIDSGAFIGVAGYTTSLINPTSEVDGTAVEIAVDNNGSGDLTGGNAANSGTVTLYYVVETL